MATPVTQLKASMDKAGEEYEVQTDKDEGKVVGCTVCEKSLVVNAFYAPAKARCSEHRDAPIQVGDVAPRKAEPEFVFNDELEPEVQTDKSLTKDVPCRECGRRLTVNTFYAPAKARCLTCKGASGGTHIASVGQPVPGVTDPAKAAKLKDCLVNPQFATALCPVHPDNEDHEMELKSVSHSEHYGPTTLVVDDRTGRREYRQDAVGESVLLQCVKCKATVSYSTQVVSNLRAQNEPRDVTGEPGAMLRTLLGERPEPSETKEQAA